MRQKVCAIVVVSLLMSVLGMAQTAPDGMSLVPAGEFWMGRVHMFFWDEIHWTDRDRLDDQPSRQISLDAFYMDKYEVTNADYQRFTNTTSHRRPWHWPGGQVTAALEKLPVYNVDWNDAVAYCTWAGKRLPTEAEWEKAARGGLDRKLYPWGDEIGVNDYVGMNSVLAARRRDPSEKKMAHYNAPNGPTQVGSFPPNGYDLYDVIGNVWEWVSDWYDRDYYVLAPLKNPKGPDTGIYRVTRGGGWTGGENLPKRSTLGVHYRSYSEDSQLSNAIGFRCAKSADASSQTKP